MDKKNLIINMLLLFLFLFMVGETFAGENDEKLEKEYFKKPKQILFVGKQVQSTKKFYEKIENARNEQEEPDSSTEFSEGSVEKSLALLSDLITRNRLPIITEKMSVGKVEKTKTNIDGGYNIFVIGADDYSIQWILANRDRFIKDEAYGLLVQVEDRDELQQIMQITKGLSVVPASGNGISDEYGITHYPVYITHGYFEQ